MKAKDTKTPPKASRARRARRTKPASKTTEAEDKALEEHVAKLIELGWVKPGKKGPLPAELLRPGPRYKGDLQKAIRWARDD